MSFNPKVALYSGQTLNIDYTPVSAVSAGDVVVIAGRAYFSQNDIAAAALGALAYSGGVWKGNKITGAISAGDEIYWDPTGSPNTGTASTGAFTKTYAAGLASAGIATAAAASGDQFVYFVKSSALSAGVNGVGASYKIARGQATTVAASDTIVTGLATVVAAVANLEDVPVIGCDRAQADIGDQSAAPVAGSILIKTFKPTGTGDATPIAATTFTKKVNWIAIGT